ncbi:MAG: TrpR family protein YerC/YecD [Candidatus Moranbacteria bacterium GW2011_GWC2_37_73]|nr:MAG: hypothetical protein UR95_C0006G0014 [Parcubacteria group bacterium GW2011_GWC1_36_108]KKP99992.1 MAG: TrpR family protein YerC/YecD [Candidatus Moranbacteria bacterium GW2011_GWD1_36_198]KKQ00259.1 MAG: TrpR family protein YerC/YecD [Candidatus Moranbacteria bacterium GW2011_GWD2_36_198]KKQ39323.1 MAG: TrpR family protein YerC/YecD [Candidatus Moranbacteria bacterium GW2011_GWC2_37_73]HAR99890.1 hypothetical protein [Candidatus Moranbacteria bacterium]
MSKVKVYSIDKKEKQKIINDLFEIFVELKTKNEVFTFLLGLFTPSEVVMIARRIQVVKMIIDGACYDEIRIKLKVSNQTITKMEHWLRGDDEKTEFITRKINSSRKRKEKSVTRRTDGGMLDKYAHHRFLKDLLG